MIEQMLLPHGLERSHRYFCYVCGTLLGHDIEVNNSLTCRKCKTSTFLHWFSGMEVSFDNKCTSIDVEDDQPSPYFHSMLKGAKKILRSEIIFKKTLEGQFMNEDKHYGPSIRKECAYCGNERMTYVTLQTRSADEGQTVIYTCTQCSKKEIENT